MPQQLLESRRAWVAVVVVEVRIGLAAGCPWARSGHMTAADWDSCTDLQAILTSLRGRGKLSERKARLFAVAVCRRTWHLLNEQWSRMGVEVAERFADGRATVEDLSQALSLAWRAYHAVEQTWIGAVRQGTHRPDDAEYQARLMAAEAVGRLTADEDPRVPHREGLSRMDLVVPVVADAAWSACRAVLHAEGSASTAEQIALAALRDIFGNPSRAALLDPSWLTRDVIALAQAAYDTRALPTGHLDPARLLVLADALEDAGCTDVELLGHLRGEGPHWRGCFALDAILGKS